MRSFLNSSCGCRDTYLEAVLITELEYHLSPVSSRVCGIEDLKEK